jgi:ParB-like chromosome segregation protein Spo0J
MPSVTFRRRKAAELVLSGKNPRKINKVEFDRLVTSLQEDPVFFELRPIIVNVHPERKDIVIAGHQRLAAARALGLEEVPCVEVEADEREENRWLLKDNKHSGEWDDVKLAAMIEAMNEEERRQTGLGQGEMEKLLAKTSAKGEKRAVLREKFLIPPMSVLDARQGYWQDRKKKWLDMGIASEENLLRLSASGRDPGYYKQKEAVEKELGHAIETETFEQEYYQRPESGAATQGTSIFDPVLCELAYRWFAPPGAIVLDPFAGGSVRGLVAALVGCKYTGIDLRMEQVEENRAQAARIFKEEAPDGSAHWAQGDSAKAIDSLPDREVDFVFSCPPYADLEVYSDTPGDLSNMDYADFLVAYRTIIKKSADRLKNNRFACFVVGDVRAADGTYRNFVSDTIQAFVDAGMRLYNEAIFVTPYGSLPIRAGKQFEGSRKLGKTHQNMIVMAKGNPEEACALMQEPFAASRQLAEQHEKVLTFIKGDGAKATADLGAVKVENEAFIMNAGGAAV